jgi:pimeloyl-ACP methyl ester carboxylesterase
MAARSILSQPPLWREGRLGFEAARLARDPVYGGEGVVDAGGQPVLLIPGFLAGDNSLGLMTRWLRRTGHHTRKAGMRSNIDCSEAAVGRLEERLEAFAHVRRQRVAIVGQSRGGVFAKVLAVRRPDLVSGIVTLGSPTVEPLAIHPLVRAQVFAVGLLGTLGAPGLFRRSCLDGDCCRAFDEDLAAPLAPDAGYLAIYSRSDGVVDWRACLDPAADRHLEVEASHCGMSLNAAAYRAIAEALARYRGARRRRRPVGTLRKAA